MRKDILDEVAKNYNPVSPQQDFDYWFIRLGAEEVCANLSGDSVLELGCGSGITTEILARKAKKLVVVEGSDINIERAKERAPGAEFISSLWEDYTPTRDFSDVVLMNGLDHVEDPVWLLQHISKWPLSRPRLHVIVNNADSLHRQLGVELKIIQFTTSMTERDALQQHHRVYTMDGLENDLMCGGWGIKRMQGILIKMLPNDQMRCWDEKLIRALLEVGRFYVDLTAQLYVTARRL